MRVVVLTGDRPNHAALCHKLAASCHLAAIVLSGNIATKPPAHRWRLLRNRIEGRVAGRPFVSAWRQMQERYRSDSPRFPEVPVVRVGNVNDGDTVRCLAESDPELVVVSGTNLVGRQLLEVASGSMLNLHTGLSPYVKGGPNCTNWCLAMGSFHLIGSTVMWLDRGIDSGPIIATEQTALTGRETLTELHWKVMEHAHGVCVRVVQALAAGRALPRVPQDQVASGRTFYTIEWDGRAMRHAWVNFKRYYTPAFFNTDEYRMQSSRLKLFPFDV